MYESGKMRSVETILRIGGGDIKGERWRGWIKLCTLVNITMYPQYNNNMIIKIKIKKEWRKYRGRKKEKKRKTKMASSRMPAL
jgi:hypothetical protein